MAFSIETRGDLYPGLEPSTRELLCALDSNANGSERAIEDTTVEEPSIEKLRQGTNALEPFALSNEVVDFVEDHHIETDGGLLQLRIYRSGSEQNMPVVLFFHGGCWVFCDLDTHDSICRYICARGGFLMVSVDYRLAPEFPFPAAIEDAQAALQWLSINGAELGADMQRLAVMGDIAGGNIAAVLSALDSKGKDLISAQALLYPITDVTDRNSESYISYGHNFFFESDFLEWASNLYLAEASASNPDISPLLADDVSALPNTLVVTAECDILRDQGEAYAKKLCESGVKASVSRYRGVVHAFVAMAGAVDLGRQAIEFITNNLQPKSQSSE